MNPCDCLKEKAPAFRDWMKKKWAAFRERAIKFFLMPVVPGFLALIAPLAGAWTAFRHESIGAYVDYLLKKGTAICLNQPSPILDGCMAPPPGDFFILGVLFFVLAAGFSGHKWAEATRSKQHFDFLASSVETLPPQEFLHKFSQWFHQSCESITIGLKEPDKPSEGSVKRDPREAIKELLTALAALALSFDPRRSNIRCSINVMVFEAFPTTDPTRSATLLKNAKFVEPQTCETSLAGVLVLDPELTLTIYKNQTEPDKAVSPLILPIPATSLRSDRSKRTTVLPGAPAAFCDNEYQFCDSTDQFDTMMANTGLRPAILGEIVDYFLNEGAGIKSFISLPLNIPVTGGNCIRVGVVNIHSDKPGMLRGLRGVQLFTPLAEPYCIFLAHLIKNLEPRVDAQP